MFLLQSWPSCRRTHGMELSGMLEKELVFFRSESVRFLYGY